MHEQISVLIRVLPSGKEITMTIPLTILGSYLKKMVIEHPELEVPTIDKYGDPLIYKLLSKSTGKEVKDKNSLQEFNISDGDLLLLANVLSAGGPQLLRSTKNIEFLDWLSQNNVETTNLSVETIYAYLQSKGKPDSISFIVWIRSTNMEVEFEAYLTTTVIELYQSLIENGIIAAYDAEGNQIGYELFGLNCRNSETLFEAGLEENGFYILQTIPITEGYILPYTRLIELNNWLRKKYPRINILVSIPNEKIKQLIQRFFEDKGYDDIAPINTLVDLFKQTPYGPFSNQKNSDRWRMIAYAIFNRQKLKQKIINLIFRRYEEIKFHGFFLFPQGDETYRNVYKKYWEDINHLTSDYIDLYFTQEELAGKSGFETLNGMESIRHLAEEIILPSLIFWNVEQGLKNAIAIPLKGFSTDYIIFILQVLVKAIKKKIELREIGGFVQHRIEKSLLAPTGLNLNVTYIEKQEATNIYNIENLKNT